MRCNRLFLFYNIKNDSPEMMNATVRIYLHCFMPLSSCLSLSVCLSTKDVIHSEGQGWKECFWDWRWTLRMRYILNRHGRKLWWGGGYHEGKRTTTNAPPCLLRSLLASTVQIDQINCFLMAVQSLSVTSMLWLTKHWHAHLCTHSATSVFSVSLGPSICLSICLSIFLFVGLPVRSLLRLVLALGLASQAWDLSPGQPGLGPSQSGLRTRQPGLTPINPGLTLRQPGLIKSGHMDRLTDK